MCACIRKTRVRESLESVREQATMNRHRFLRGGSGEAVGIANGVVVVGGVNGNIFPFNESPAAYSVTGTGRDVIPGGSGAVWDRGEGGFAFSPARAPSPPLPPPPMVARARVSTLFSRAVHTPRGLSLLFLVVPTGARTSLAGVALRRPQSSFLPSYRHQCLRESTRRALSESTVSVESPGPRRRTVTRCGGVRKQQKKKKHPTE